MEKDIKFLPNTINLNCQFSGPNAISAIIFEVGGGSMAEKLIDRIFHGSHFGIFFFFFFFFFLASQSLVLDPLKLGAMILSDTYILLFTTLYFNQFVI